MHKSDVHTHRDHYGPSRPAVNVKVYEGLTEGLRAFRKVNPEIPERFTEEWIRKNLSTQQLEDWWGFACEDCFEMAEDMAQDIFGKSIQVYTEGRSGGWLVIDGLKDLESWNAIDLSKWGKFAKHARACADDVPYRAVDSIYYNVFVTAEAERDQELADAANH